MSGTGEGVERVEKLDWVLMFTLFLSCLNFNNKNTLFINQANIDTT